MKTNFEVDGWDNLAKMMKKCGKIPQACVVQGAKAGAKIALKAAKQKAPHKTWALRDALITSGERKTADAKKVYDIMIDGKKNALFQKKTKTGTRRRKLKERVVMQAGDYYYPASQEYGFVKKDGTKVEGKHYLRDSLMDNKSEIEHAVIAKLSSEIDKKMR